MDTQTVLLIATLVSASIGFLAYALTARREEKRRHQDVVNRIQGVARESVGLPIEQEGTFGWLAEGAKRLVARFGEAVKPKEAQEISKLREKLIHAGYRQPKAVEIYWGIKAGGALVGVLVGCLVAFSRMMSPQYRMFALILITAVGFYVPGVVLSKRVAARQKAIQRGLPDALDLLVVCVEAGMGLDAAIYRVCVEMTRKEPILSGELRLLTLELRAGKSRREALKNLSNRIGLEDVGSLVALLIQADVFGTSIAQTLRVYADAMRTKRFQRAEELAAKLPVKLLFPLVFFIFPTLLIVILGPAGLRLMQMFSATVK